VGLDARFLPAFPWDTLVQDAAIARAHPAGIIDLSVGTPVDPTPSVIRKALETASDSPGYPTTQGTPELRAAVVAWFERRRGVRGLDPSAVLPTIGSKELVAALPALLGLGAGDVVVHPTIAYPTYDVGARLAGAIPVPADDVGGWPSDGVRLVWVNSPSNPTGVVQGVEELAAVVAEARARGAVVASDECYAELAWEEPWAGGGVPSILDARVSGGDLRGLLAVYSLSKQSNLAGYRAAFVAGDPDLIAALLELRKHAGMIMPGPVQAAMTAALADDGHVEAQRELYRARRATLAAALGDAGYLVDDSQAGLYLWVRTPGAGQDCRTTVRALAGRGILVAPGDFYGPAGAGHIRMSLTATDAQIDDAARRLRLAQSDSPHGQTWAMR
jgi:succinyldiaminopimelate transaminase